MSQVEVLKEIEHLDFEPEKEQAKRHWGDPIRRDHWWCGEKMSSRDSAIRFTESGILKTGNVTCVKCLQLGISLGLGWWWKTHRKFYGSTCTTKNHNCGA